MGHISPPLDVNWWMFIAWSCGQRKELSSGWQAHPSPQSMGLWLQDLLVSHQKYKGASCLWGMDTNGRDESAPSTLQRCTRVRGRNPTKPALPTGNISLITSTCIKTPQNEAIFFQNQFGFSSSIHIIFEQRSVSTEHCGQEGIEAFLHSINQSQIKCAPVSFPNVYLPHDFRFLLNIIIHNKWREFSCLYLHVRLGLDMGD